LTRVVKVILSRYTDSEKELQMLINALRLQLPPQPPLGAGPKNTACEREQSK